MFWCFAWWWLDDGLRPTEPAALGRLERIAGWCIARWWRWRRCCGRVLDRGCRWMKYFLVGDGVHLLLVLTDIILGHVEPLIQPGNRLSMSDKEDLSDGSLYVVFNTRLKAPHLETDWNEPIVKWLIKSSWLLTLKLTWNRFVGTHYGFDAVALDPALLKWPSSCFLRFPLLQVLFNLVVLGAYVIKDYIHYIHFARTKNFLAQIEGLLLD